MKILKSPFIFYSEQVLAVCPCKIEIISQSNLWEETALGNISGSALSSGYTLYQLILEYRYHTNVQSLVNKL